jgi:iron(III) transport system substrate-binding protein
MVWMALTLCVALVVAACGDGSGSDTTAGPGEATTAAPGDTTGEGLSPEVEAAAAEAEENGMVFYTSHDDLVAEAMEGGAIRAQTSLETWPELQEAWSAVYPDIDITIDHIPGPDERERFLLEVASGSVTDQDVAYVGLEQFSQYLELLLPVDVLGMAEVGILDIDPRAVDPVNRNIVATGSGVGGVGYNPDLLPEEDVPDSWDDLLTETFNADNHRLLVDIRPANVAPLVPLWGLEETLEFTTALAAQDPIWVRGSTGPLSRVAAGEFSLMVFNNYDSAVNVGNESGGKVVPLLIEPVPVRVVDAFGVMGEDYSANPAAGILFLEFMMSDEAQAILDINLESSLFSPYSEIAALLEGKELSILGWEDGHIHNASDYLADIVESYGFPVAEIE